MKQAFMTLLLCAVATGMFADVPKPVAVTVADKGKTITVKIGQATVVSLPGNITTGYSWELAGIDGTAVALDGAVKYHAKKHPAGMVGVPGMFEAKFKALQPGKATVKLEWRRPWEKDKKPAETFAVTLAVEK